MNNRVWYCFVDRPWLPGEKPNRKPKREHRSLDLAIVESVRLAKRSKAKVLVLEVVHVSNYESS